MCIQSQGDGTDAVLKWGTLQKLLRHALLRLPVEQCELLKQSSVDELLLRHFTNGGKAEVDQINFMKYWCGMEEILNSCNVRTVDGADPIVQSKVESLRQFRDLVIKELPGTECSIQELRALCSRLQQASLSGAPAVASYWDSKLQDLPEDEETVSSDEIASALQTWLEELLEEEDGEDVSATSEEGGQEANASPSSPSRPPPGPLKLPGLQRVLSGSRGAQGYKWLLAPETGLEEPEVKRFHQVLIEHLGPDLVELSMSRLYRAVRDTLDEEEDGGAAAASAASAALAAQRVALTKAGAERLSAVVLRQVRPAFRALEGAMRKARRFDHEAVSPPQTGLSTDGGIMTSLICSQAEAAEVLERRAIVVPRAFRIVWLLEKARRRGVCEAWVTWRKLLRPPTRSPQSPLSPASPTSPLDGSGSSGLTLPLPPSPEARSPKLVMDNMGPSPRRWGGVPRSGPEAGQI